jgi:long-chain fatty acid transport protein
MTLAAAATLAPAGRGEAAGFFINQQSVPGLGRAFAGSAASANDPSTAFYNPAGMTHLFDPNGKDFGFVGSAGANLIIARSRLKDDGSTAATPSTLGVATPYPGDNATDPADPTLVGNFYAIQRLYPQRIVAGLGITTPFGLSGKFDRDWFGRYDSLESKLTTVNIGPVLAVRLNDYLSLGAGLDVQYADSTLSSAIPNPLAPGGVSPATDAKFEANGDDWTLGYNAGVLLTIPDTGLRIGVHYRSEMDHQIEGSARISGFTGPLSGLNGAVDAEAKSDLPAILSTGIAYVAVEGEEVKERLTLYADFSYFWWGDSEEARIEFEDGRDDAVRETNFRDTYSVGIGADYRWNERLTLRTGFRYDRTPTVDRSRDTTFADANRYWVTLGASYVVRPWLTADLGVAHVFEDDTTVDVERQFFQGTAAASTVRVKADVQSSVSTIGLNARIRF